MNKEKRNYVNENNVKKHLFFWSVKQLRRCKAVNWFRGQKLADALVNFSMHFALNNWNHLDMSLWSIISFKYFVAFSEHSISFLMNFPHFYVLVFFTLLCFQCYSFSTVVFLFIFATFSLLFVFVYTNLTCRYKWKGKNR